MNHEQAIQQSATERYLMDELSPELRDEFEEHFFECSECALDVRAASLFVEQSKQVLAEEAELAPAPAPVQTPTRAGWFSWLRPAFAVPVFALLLAVLGYQNFVTYPEMRAAADRPQVLHWAPINTRTRGAVTPIVATHRGGTFLLFLNIPPDPRYSRYIADLYSSSGKLEWSLPIAAQQAEDTTAVQVPAGNRAGGVYSIALRGIGDSGQSTEISRTQFELQIEN